MVVESLSFSHNSNATDANLAREQSSDLQPWCAAPAELVSATVASFETELITIRLPPSAASSFVRFRATRADREMPVAPRVPPFFLGANRK